MERKNIYKINETTNTFLIWGTTHSYSLLGQNGFSNIDYEFDVRNYKVFPNESVIKRLSAPIVDNIMTLVGDEYVKRIAPGQDGVIRMFVYD